MRLTRIFYGTAVLAALSLFGAASGAEGEGAPAEGRPFLRWLRHRRAVMNRIDRREDVFDRREDRRDRREDIRDRREDRRDRLEDIIDRRNGDNGPLDRLEDVFDRREDRRDRREDVRDRREDRRDRREDVRDRRNRERFRRPRRRRR
ncbi:MAG: hypothetical protein ACYTGB_08455 [Planctomycetota bacterium]|jgi:hypothetical protein